MNLPITKYKSKIKELVKNNQVVIIAGQTGSGKTTQVPQYLSQYKQCISQPRRISAVTVASRIAFEMKTTLGQQVGYSVRFDQKRSNKTKILFATDGMALRQMMIGRQYQLYIIDEAHQRTLNTDILMAVLKLRLLKKIKLIVMSATLDIQKYLNYFNSSAYVVVQGRSYPISIYYTLIPVSDYIQSLINTTLQIAFQQQPGNILGFLTGQQQIDMACKEIKKRISNSGVDDLQCYPLYSILPNQQQIKIFEQKKIRKIIISTNISQTAVTIPGVLYVVDCGLVKMKIYDSLKNTQILAVLPQSQSNAVQRAGRAGRIGPGKCFRLYTQQTYYSLKKFMTPQIIRTNLRGTILQLKSLGINNFNQFPLLDRPQQIHFRQGIEYLINLKALDNNEDITQLGKKMSVLPVDPVFSYILIKSIQSKYKCINVILSIVALQNIQSLFYVQTTQKEKISKVLKLFLIQNSDHLTKTNILHSYFLSKNKKAFCKQYHINQKSADRALLIRQQLSNYMASLKIVNQMQLYITGQVDIQRSKKLLLNQLKLKGKLGRDGLYIVDKVGSIKVHPQSVLQFHKKKPQNIVYTQLLQTNKLYLREVTGE